MRIDSEIVMDASAYIRASQGNVEAVQYLRAQAYGAVVFVEPPHFLIEVASALRNSFIARQSTAEGSRAALRALLGVKIEIDNDPELTAESLAFALERGITTYDAAYAALAIRRSASLVTADFGLVQAARATGVAATLISDGTS